jgi:hypothetical protein
MKLLSKCKKRNASFLNSLYLYPLKYDDDMVLEYNLVSLKGIREFVPNWLVQFQLDFKEMQYLLLRVPA